MQAKIFSSAPDGIKVHWEISAEKIGLLISDVTGLLKWLTDNEEIGQFGPDNGFGTQPAPRPAVLPAAPQPAPQAPAPPQAQAEWVWYGDQKHCSLHGPAVFRQGGVSKTTGKPYNAFWSCTNRNCRPVGEN